MRGAAILLAAATLAAQDRTISSDGDVRMVAFSRGGNAVSGRVHSVVFQGSRTLVEVDAGRGERLLAELSGREATLPRVADEIRLAWPVSETFAFPAEVHA